MTDNNDEPGPDWEGVARKLLALELDEQARKLEDRTHEVTEQLRNGEEITDDELETILTGIEEFWHYIDRHLVAVADIEELPENLEAYWR